MSLLTQKTLRISTGILLLIVALNAFGGGYYGLSGAPGVPVEWLKGSPFTSYFIPSLFLFIVVGGISLFAAVAVFKNYSFAGVSALSSSIIILAWISIQLLIIGYVSWMQPATALAGIIILCCTVVLLKE